MAENQAHQQSPRPKTETQDRQGRKPAQAIQPSSRSKTPTPDRRRRKPAPLPTFEDNSLVLQIIQKRPLLVASALCASMLLAALIAAIGLTHPDNANKIKGESADAAATEKATESSQTEEKPPLGLYAAIGLGCAAGSWGILRTLQSPRRRRRRQLSKSLKPRPTPRQQQQKTTSSSRRRVAASRREVAANQQKMGETTLQHPSGETPPRSTSKSTLADTMDTRRRHSLSSVKRNR